MLPPVFDSHAPLRRAFHAVAAAVVLAGGVAPRAAAQQRTMVGDVAVEVRLDSGRVRVGLADSAASVELAFLSRDVHRWVTTATRLVRAPATRGRVLRTGTARLEEPGNAAGNLALTRRDSAGVVRYTLFASDREFIDVRGQIAGREAVVLVETLRRAVAADSTPARRQRGPGAARRN